MDVGLGLADTFRDIKSPCRNHDFGLPGSSPAHPLTTFYGSTKIKPTHDVGVHDTGP